MKNIKQNRSKLLFLLPALLSLAAAVCMFMEHRFLGFPDGHFTALDVAMQVFYRVAIPVCLLFSAGFVFLAVSVFRSKAFKAVLLWGFGSAVVTGTIILYYLCSTLDNGVGG